MKRTLCRALISAFALVLGVSQFGCTSPYDYSNYLAHMPQSILVLPPLNESPEVNASYDYLSTVTLPLAERGYYVFPVAMVDHFMKENGLPTPGEMHLAPLDKINEFIGADAVLYATIKQWGTSYVIINSQTTVSVQARLVDVRTGTTIWQGTQTLSRNSSSGQSNPIGMLAAALIQQVVDTMADAAHDVSKQTNWMLIHDDHHGLLIGDDHPEYEEDQKRREEDQKELDAKKGSDA